MRAGRGVVAGVPCELMRLGFTGEPSFELHHAADRSVELWRALTAAGGDLGVRPHGLEALLGLRLEKGHVIVGMDTDFDSTPRRLGMGWAVRRDGVRDFLGGHALERVDAFPLDRKLIGLELDGAAPVDGSPLFADGVFRGNVTTAWSSPVLGRTVMLAFAELAGGELPASFTVDGREARVVEVPFYDPEGTRVRA
jgi:sarcosine oxidase subunit alpha